MFWFQVKKKTKEIKQKTKSKILKCLQANQKKKINKEKRVTFFVFVSFSFRRSFFF